MTRSMLQHLGTPLRVLGVVALSLALASFTVEVHPGAPASEWLRWFCVVGATVAAAALIACFFATDAEDPAQHDGAHLRH